MLWWWWKQLWCCFSTRPAWVWHAREAWVSHKCYLSSCLCLSHNTSSCFYSASILILIPKAKTYILQKKCSLLWLDVDIPHQAKRSWQVWKSRDVTKGKDAGLHKHSFPHLPPWLQSWVNQHAALHHMHQTTSSTTPNHKMKYMHHDNLQYLYAHQSRIDLCGWCSALKCISPHLSPPVSGSAAALLCCTITQLHKPTFQFCQL